MAFYFWNKRDGRCSPLSTCFDLLLKHFNNYRSFFRVTPMFYERDLVATDLQSHLLRNACYCIIQMFFRFCFPSVLTSFDLEFAFFTYCLRIDTFFLRVGTRPFLSPGHPMVPSSGWGKVIQKLQEIAKATEKKIEEQLGPVIRKSFQYHDKDGCRVEKGCDTLGGFLTHSKRNI